MAQVLAKLLAASERGDVNWDAQGSEYIASFPNYSLGVSSDDFSVAVKIYNEHGDTVEDVDSETTTAFKLFETARRRALGLDQALDSILKSIPDDPDDDLPF